MVSELLSVLCTFENSKNCNEISFDADSFLRITKRYNEESRKVD